MTSEALLTLIADYLRACAEPTGGVVTISHTPDETLDLLATSPNRWRLIVQWQSESPVGTVSNAMDMSFLLIIQLNEGLTAGSNTSGLPYLAKASEVTQWMRALRIASAYVDNSDRECKGKSWLLDNTRSLVLRFVRGYAQDAVPDITVKP